MTAKKPAANRTCPQCASRRAGASDRFCRACGASLADAGASGAPATTVPLQLYADFVARVHLGLVIWRLDDLDDPRSFRLLAANAASSAIVRRPLSSSAGQLMVKCLPALFQTDRPAIYAEVVRSGRPTNVENVVYSNPRVAKTVFLIQAFPLPDQCLGLVLQDVTAQRTSDYRARESDERLWAALAAAGAGVYRWDIETAEVEADDNLLRLFGFPLAPRVQQLTAFEQAVHPEDRAAFAAQIERCIRYGADFELEYRVVWPDASVHWLFDKGKAFRNEQGRPEYMTGACVDITDRKAAQHERDALARTEKLRALGQMASGVAHDINQSLAAIVGYGDLARAALDEADPDPAQQREALDIIVRAATDAGETVKRLLTFARGQPRGPMEEIEIGSLLIQAAQLTAPRWRDAAQAEGRSIRLDVETEGDLRVRGWPASLREALTNLIFNAVDALPTGGTIRLECRQQSEQVLVTVADSGTGMPADVQGQIFEPFFTTKGERGTGLGLAQVFGIVEQHGGRIGVESAPGQGTTFLLSFPAVTRRLPDPMPHTDRPPGAPRRVLVVDDELTLGRMIATMLQIDGHEVTVVTSADEALERLGDTACDLIITDVGMPGMSGWELAERSLARYPHIPIVLATGWGASIDAADARRRGIAAVIAKPYRTADLREVVALHGANALPERP